MINWFTEVVLFLIKKFEKYCWYCMILVKTFILYDYFKCLWGGRESNYLYVVLIYFVVFKFIIFISYGRYYMYIFVFGGLYNRIFF